MPASTRHHRALAVFVHCLGILAAVPALPAAAPEAAAAPRPAAATPQPAPSVPPAATTTPTPGPAVVTPPATVGPAPPAVAVAARAPLAASAEPTPPSAPPAVAPPSRVPASAPPPPVTVAVATESSPAPRYRIHVRNVGNSPLDTTVRQELPSGSSPTAISGGGRSSSSGGSTAEVTWRLRLPAHSTTTLGTALTAVAPGQPLTAPACAFTSDGTRPYDCASATWQAAGAPAAEVTEAPPWRRYPVLLAGLGVLVLLSALVTWVWRRRRGGRVTAAALATNGTPDGGRGTIYPRAASPSPSRRRRTPPVWLLVGAAVVVLAGLIGTAGWTATRQVSSIDTQKQPTSGAWMGTGISGPVGVPLRESAFEFTVYRMSCAANAAGGSAATPAGGRRCQATVGVRNVTGAQQPWHGQLQRAYLPGGRWVSTDEPATRAANLGRDVFANPVAAGSRVVVPLVFSVDGRDPPRQLELRSGVFSAGVRVQMP
ncbi:hypothetical protein OOJ91_27905 [Micromonospora lupini]|uniref:hypothetical protein n=1 Tax=Micromonospora lupini TaxID=285679 RepID=UPI002256CAD9|nr:hypothetical protein [Micromonospora lupini]MCX5069677.1 hypothetical protein [Micromonospora lupini]